MLIERLLPRYDAVRIEHRVVPGDVEAAYGAVMRADFMRAWRESAGVRVLFAARSLGERAVAAASRRAFVEPAVPESLRVEDTRVQLLDASLRRRPDARQLRMPDAGH
jgi:hypothetical protein